LRDTRLILIDGLPGSGKSTTAEWLAARLHETGRDVTHLPEFGPGHPLNVGGELHPAGAMTGEALFTQYTVESYAAESLERWCRYVAAHEERETVTVADSYPFQNSVRVLMQMGVETARLRAYFHSVEDVIAPLRPVVLYFRQSDPPCAIRTITAQRGPEWTEHLVATALRSPAAQARGLTGIEGVEALIREYSALMDTLGAESRFPRLVMEDCRGRWPECYAEILAFLDVPALAR
jgi:thymidylate kinase